MRKVSVGQNVRTGEKGNRCESCTNSSPYFASFESYMPLGDREGELDASERSAGRPAFRSTGTKSSGHEELAVRKNRTDCFL